MKTMIATVSLVGFLVVCCMIEVSHGAPYWPNRWIGTPDWQTLPECSPVQSEPCDKAVKRYRTSSLDSDVIFRTDTPVCSCPSNKQCPTGYSNGGPKTIAYKDSANKISISLHYCDDVYSPEERECVGNEVAVLMEGGRIPEQIKRINCRCPLDSPMRIKKSYFENWRNVKELVCEMPVCSISDSNRPSRCQNVTRVRDPVTTVVTFPSTNLCDCPRGYECVRETPNSQRTEYFSTCQSIRNN